MRHGDVTHSPFAPFQRRPPSCPAVSSGRPTPCTRPRPPSGKKLLEDGQRRWVRSSCREGREGRRGRPLIVNQQTRTAASHYKWDDDLVTGLPGAHRLTWGYFDKVKLSSKAATLRRWAPRKSESQRSSLPRPKRLAQGLARRRGSTPVHHMTRARTGGVGRRHRGSSSHTVAQHTLASNISPPLIFAPLILCPKM